MYQRGKIQDESMYYEHLKHDGTLPIIGVNTFQNPNAQIFDESSADDFEMELARATPEEKQACLERTEDRQTNESDATTAALAQLQEVARTGGNVFGRVDGNCQVCKPWTNHRGIVPCWWAIPQKYVII